MASTASMTAALPARPCTTPITYDFSRKTGLPAQRDEGMHVFVDGFHAPVVGMDVDVEGLLVSVLVQVEVLPFQPPEHLEAKQDQHDAHAEFQVVRILVVYVD